MQWTKKYIGTTIYHFLDDPKRECQTLIEQVIFGEEVVGGVVEVKVKG